MADKVVQRLDMGHSERIRGKSLRHNTSNPAIQPKCNECDENEELQKKQDPLLNDITNIQRKPIFESNDEQPESALQTKQNGNRTPIIQPKCEACEGKEENIQMKSDGASVEASSDLQANLTSSKGSGNPLSADMQKKMGSAFGTDLSAVRIHTGGTAVQMNKELNAQAFTHGNEIYFNEGKYNTNSTKGRHLLAHELTHGLQQGHKTNGNSLQKQEDTKQGTSTISSPNYSIPTSLGCSPQGLSRAEFLTQNGNDTSEFGHTTLAANSRMLNPSTLSFQRVGRGRRVKPVPITITLPSIESIYTMAGNFIEGSRHVPFRPEDDCLADTYDIQWRISTSGANKIRDGEQEHCNDYNYAYANSILPYVTEINRLANGRRSFSNERQAKRYIQRQIGFDPDDWFTRFECLVRQSLKRDHVMRGHARSSHNPIVRANAPRRSNRCRYITISIISGSLPQVGLTTSAEIVTLTDC